MKKNSLVITLMLALFSISSHAQYKATLSGFVTDAETREVLINATIADISNYVGVVTNNYGFYSLKNNGANELQIECSYVGYQPQVIKINLLRDTVVNFQLKRGIEINEIVVTSEHRSRYQNQPSTGVIEMEASMVKKLPTLLGEADLARMLQLMPGVQSGKEGSGGLYVRGGTNDQNLVLLDGMPVYNANHIGGFISIFNPSAINHVKMYKGGFPAKYGGRLSSILDINMKNGNMQNKEGNFTMGTLTSSFSYECPIIKDTSSLLIAGRRTVYDLFVTAYNYMDTNGESNGGYNLWDINVKYNKILANGSRIFYSFYKGRDKVYRSSRDKSEEDGVIYKYTQKYSNSWGNTTASVRLNKIYGQKVFANYTLGVANFNYQINEKMNAKSRGEIVGQSKSLFISSITDYSFLADYEYLIDKNHFLQFGAQSTIHHFSPSENTMSRTENIATSYDSVWGAEDIYVPDISLYLSDQYQITPKLSADLGLRLSTFFVEDKPIVKLEPRIVGNYTLSDNASLKFSFSKMSQFTHLISTSDQSFPSDFWLPSTTTIVPEESTQLSFGAFMKAKKKHEYEFSVDLYYKKLEHLVELKGGTSFIQSSSDWANQILSNGNGYVYGSEFLIEKTTGKTTGWVAYTISKNMRKFDEVDNGRWYPFRYDRRHELSIVLNHEINDHVNFSAVWVFMSGEAATLAQYKYIMNTLQFDGEKDIYAGYGEAYYYNGRNAFRTPPYHRLDINFNFVKEMYYGTRTWSIGLYNAYNKYNPYYLYMGKNSKGEPKLYSFTFFPIMPSISYSYKF